MNEVFAYEKEEHKSQTEEPRKVKVRLTGK